MLILPPSSPVLALTTTSRTPPSLPALASTLHLCAIPAVHVFETSERGRTSHYKLTSTVMLYMVKGVPKTEKAIVEGDVALGGSMTRQVRHRSFLARTRFGGGPKEITAERDRRAVRSFIPCRQHLLAHFKHWKGHRGYGDQDAKHAPGGLLQQCVLASRSSSFATNPFVLHPPLSSLSPPSSLLALPVSNPLNNPISPSLTSQHSLTPIYHLPLDPPRITETKEVVNALRSSGGFAEESKRNALQGELVGLLRGKSAAAA